MENEYWKEEVLSSLQGIKRAEPNPFLFTRIEARIEKKFGRVAVWKVRVAAVTMLVLVIVNSAALLRTQREDATQVSGEYQLSGIQTY